MPLATRRQERGSATATVLAALAGAVTVGTAVLGVTPTLPPWSFADAGVTASFTSPSDDIADSPLEPGAHDAQSGTPPTIDLSTQVARGGTRIDLDGAGFAAGERVVIRFDSDELARATADDDGAFADAVATVPDDYVAFAPASFTITAVGATSGRAAEASFRLTG